MKSEGLAAECGCVWVCVFLWSHASRVNPLIAWTTSGPEAKPLSLGASWARWLCLRSARGSHEQPCDHVCYWKSPTSYAAWRPEVTSEVHKAEHRTQGSIRDPDARRANTSIEEAAAVAAGGCDDWEGVFSVSAPTESLPATFLLRHAEDVMDCTE